MIIRKASGVMLGLVLAMMVPGWTFAADTIGVVFNGSTEVNRETFMFFRKAVGQTGFAYEFTALAPTAKATASMAGVLVLNTGRATGMDPVLATFVKDNKGKVPLVVVNLYQNQTAVTVTVIPAAKADQGVDTVTSASLWGAKGGRAAGERPAPPQGGKAPAMGAGGLNPLEMEHLAWFKAALKLISEQKA